MSSQVVEINKFIPGKHYDFIIRDKNNKLCALKEKDQPMQILDAEASIELLVEALQNANKSLQEYQLSQENKPSNIPETIYDIQNHKLSLGSTTVDPVFTTTELQAQQQTV